MGEEGARELYHIHTNTCLWYPYICIYGVCTEYGYGMYDMYVYQNSNGKKPKIRFAVHTYILRTQK